MEIVSTATAAQILGVAPGTLRYWRYMDQGPRSFRVGRHVKYRREDIEAWISSQIAATARGGGMPGQAN
jgi:predicted DNA-binding transcriptional regulator AlpA